MRIGSAFSPRFLHLFVGLLAFPVLLAAALPDSELNAQEVRLRPMAGLYLPTRIRVQERMLNAQQKVGVTIGARLTIAFNPRFDVVTGVTYLPGYATFHGTGKRIDIGTGSHLLAASTGARYWLLPPAHMLSWEIHTGLGVGFGGQPAYEDLFLSSTVTGTLGTTVRYQIGRIVSLHLRVQGRLYQVRVGSQATGGPRPPLQISFGLGLPLVESVP
jgi:hypothetical protein